MPTDEEAGIYNILSQNWSKQISGLAKPNIIYKDEQKGTTAYPNIKVYFERSDEIKPKGLGYYGKSGTFHLVLNVKSNDREEILKVRDEIIRILDLKRIRPLANIDYLTYDEGEKKNAYNNFYNWVFKVHLKQIYVAVGAI